MPIPSGLQNALAAKRISQAAFNNISTWLTSPKCAELKPEVEKMIVAEDWQTLEDSFFTIVPFGTGGRRGKCGIGSNRMNRVTFGESAQGVADYVSRVDAGLKERGVVIAYDTRLTSVEFSQYVASVFAANGFRVFLFDGFRPTPELSFAVRYLHTGIGVVISASHNPPSDNGFKAYWTDGGQIVPPHDQGIMDCVNEVTKINSTDFSEAVTQEKIQLIGKDIDEAYQTAVLKESLVTTRSAKIIYSPLHGTGITSVLPILEQAGFTVSVIKEQATPDGHFPNLPNNIPNPEVPTASELILKYAASQHADIGITSDPDADRLGLIARDKAGKYTFFNGNQIAFLICGFTLEQMQRQGKLKGKQFMATTIVTTDGLRSLAKAFGVNMYGNLLIGFKYVAETIQALEGQEQFIIGGEESHGLLKGTYARDKDAAVAALLVSELASVLKDDNKTIPDYLDELYQKYGVFCEKLQNIIYEGAEGSKKMMSIMERLRSNPPLRINGREVLKFTDRLSGLILNPKTKELIGKNNGTPGDVLIFSLTEDDGIRVTVRPSGTEPKLKVYTQVHLPIINGEMAKTKQEAETLSHQLLNEVAELCK